MKYIIKILPVLLYTFLFCSCDNEDINYSGETHNEINFVLSQTRSTQTGMFEIGDDIGVFAIERTNQSQVGNLENPKYVNLQYRYNGTQFVPVTQKVEYSGKKYDFYVYSPYNPTSTNISQLLHSASVNQVHKDNWELSDLCSAVNTTGIATGNVSLDFKHKFATVKLIVDSGVSAVSLLQVYTLGKLDFVEDKAQIQGSKTDVSLYKESSVNYLATIPVQRLSGTVFKITKSNNGTVDFKLSSPKTLTEGVNVIYTISLKAQIKIHPAPNGNTSGGGEFQMGDTCTVKATPDGGYVFEGWYENGNKVSSDPEYKFVVTGDRELTPLFQSAAAETWNYEFTVTNWQLYSGWEAGSGSVSIVSLKRKYLNGIATGETVNIGYTVNVSSSWINATNNSGYLSWSANASTSPRSGEVYWKQNESGKTDYAWVHQDGKPNDVVTKEVSYEISVDPTSHTFASTGGSKTFTVKLYKVTKTFTNGTLTSTQRIPLPYGWTSTTSGTGFSNSGDTVTAAPNPNTTGRSGTFMASYMGVSASANLYQEGNEDGEIIIED